MIEDFHKLPPYALEKSEKEQLLLSELNQLTALHRARCAEYANYLDAIGYFCNQAGTLEEVPFVPVSLWAINSQPFFVIR